MTLLAKQSLVWTGIVIITAAIVFGCWWNYTFPYGPSHCCDIGLHMELRCYAEKHDGWFPRGESSPEASLSLLYRDDPDIAYILRGKSVPYTVVRDTLERGELLGPETCGWQYVEGLRVDDDRRLAVFWDKAGLAHNGARLSSGGHIVTFVGGHQEYIVGSKWEEFLQEQQQLLARLTELRAVAKAKDK
jgi:hypothetical protein